MILARVASWQRRAVLQLWRQTHLSTICRSKQVWSGKWALDMLLLSGFGRRQKLWMQQHDHHFIHPKTTRFRILYLSCVVKWTSPLAASHHIHLTTLKVVTYIQTPPSLLASLLPKERVRGYLSAFYNWSGTEWRSKRFRHNFCDRLRITTQDKNKQVSRGM